ncbi:MAG TPA: type II and III secretion system protein [Bryobacteraceae bacterium]|jgi:type II secretory pathway component GspD/PulD (secretin)|nr:type II and III secretion system protein [Bryobacteraceae bacterium]
MKAAPERKLKYARPDSLKLGILICLVAVATCFAANDPVAARLARAAESARDSGQLVHAYLLYAEAAARDPRVDSYRQNRDALAPVAKLLTAAQVEPAPDIKAEIQAAESPGRDENNPSLRVASVLDVEEARNAQKYQGLPQLKPAGTVRDFDLRGNTKTLYDEVVAPYGIRVILDRDLAAGPTIHFEVSNVGFHDAMEELTLATHTFLFPVSANTIFVAQDTEPKRAEYEPTVEYAVPLLDAIDARQLTEAATAVRSAFYNMRGLAFDPITRTVIIRDRISRARAARSLFEALVLPKGQVSIEVQLLTLDTQLNYEWGMSLPTAFQLADFGKIGGQVGLASGLSSVASFAFGGGASLFGLGITQATIFATYTHSFTKTLYDATVTALDNQPVSFHVGDKYPIPQATYSGYAASTTAALYNPIGPVTLEDLGLEIKMTPHINGREDVALDVDGAFKSLGTLVLDSVPSIAEREFQGSVRLREGEWAVIAGLDQSTKTRTRTGLMGLSQIPILDQILSDNQRDETTSNTLILIKPRITRLPMSDLVSPEYFVGSRDGFRVLM